MRKRNMKAVSDLVMIFVATTVALFVEVYFDLFEEFQRWSRSYERWQVDELVVVPLVFGLAFGFYFWRRWKEFKAESSDREKAQNALEENEKRLRSLMQNARDIIMLMDADGTISYLNPAVEEMLGYKPEDVVGTDSFTPVHPDDAARVQHIFAGAISNPGVTSWMELRLQHADGSWRHVETYCTSLLHDPTVRSIVVNSRDVTERRQAEAALQESYCMLRAVTEGTTDFIYMKDLNGRYVMVNSAAASFIGKPAQEIIGKCDSELFPPEIAHDFIEQDRKLIASGATQAYEERDFVVDGETRSTSAVTGVWRDACGEVIGVFGISRDMTEHKRAEKKLQESEINLAQAQQMAHLGSWEYEPKENRIYWSDETYRIFGITPQQFVPTFETFLGSIHPDDRVLVREDMAKLLRGEQPPDGIEFRIVRPDGEVRCIQGQRHAEYTVTSGLLKMVGTLQDVTERQRAEEALRKSEARHRAILEATPDLVFRVGRDGEYLDFHASDESMLYVPPEEIVGKNLRDAMPPELIPPIFRRIAKALDTGEMQFFEYQLLVAEGIREFEARLVAVGSGEVLAIVRDITERKTLERRLEHRAFHDPLTGLPNRILFLDRLKHALARTGRHGESVAVLFVDLDNFKVVNDSMGHEAGDALLVAVAERLLECLRPEDTLAHLSGDEFAILIEDVEGTSDATVAAERVAQALRAPFGLEGQEVFVTASIGVTFGGFPQVPPEALLRSADLAMYWAKETGKAHHEVFRPEMNERALKRLSMESELRRALERDELRVCYQPMVVLSTELQDHLRASGRKAIVAQKAPELPRIVGMEALVRWEHPERGLLPPGEFVSFAEENGLIVPIGRWVLEEACRQAKEWQEQHPSGPHLVMSVNVSAAQFRSPELVEDVARVLQETGLEAGMLTLEITESILMEDARTNADTLERLKALGVGLAIDDFGTGYSSLSYLKRLPVDYLKVDKSFVANMGHDSQDGLLVSGVIYLAHGLGLKVIAEGVERSEQLAQLRKMGCDMAQGYYFSRPLAVEAATLLASTPSVTAVDPEGGSRVARRIPEHPRP